MFRRHSTDDDTHSPQSDFITLLRDRHPDLLPNALHPSSDRSTATSAMGHPPDVDHLPHGTTILAVRFGGGVLIAGDRQATAGYEVADRTIDKVFEMDEHSAMAIAGVAAPATQMAKLLRTQLEFYEKVEGTPLSLEGKANYLSLLLRQNLAAAMQGLVVVPIFAGYDHRRREGRIYKYDPIGGRYEELDYYATGSGGKDARSTLKKRYHAGVDRDEAVRMTVEALLDASDEDVATQGFDFMRGIFPTMKIIVEEGTEDVPAERLREIAETFLDEWRRDHGARRSSSDGA
ncbi:proteasome subunit beta [Candidatus Poribacteria bacterium]|nr:proteasome subunit beta [Candidatus Poribacteria bacterium]MBT7099061.1 proteasome subunit beta [Candidatus Poribacteria bacterium]MBT7805676.1 proteasome subunit beta [Candidatus Poribacteria bacterium]